MNLILTLGAIVLFVYLRFLLNKNIDLQIEKDIKSHFQEKGLKVIKIEKADSKELEKSPLKVPNFSPSTGMEGRNYFIDKFWKITLLTDTNDDEIKWVNSGHFFMWKMYIIVKE